MSDRGDESIGGWICGALGLTAMAVLLLTWRHLPPLHNFVDHPQRWVDSIGPDQAVIELVGLLTWILLAWLTAILLVAAATTLPGTGGRAAVFMFHRVAPVALRRTLTLVLGIAMATPAIQSSFAQTHHEHALVASQNTTGFARKSSQHKGLKEQGDTFHRTSILNSSQQPDLHNYGQSTTRPLSVGWPMAHGIQGACLPNPAHQSVITVKPNDSLWLIARSHLCTYGAVNEPKIDAEWRRWYAANQTAIGDNPNLIHPGLKLITPSPTS